MRHGWAALIAAMVTASAWGCADGGQITGEVVLAKGFSGQGVFAGLWGVPATPSGTTLVPTGDEPMFLGYLAIGIAGSSQQSFKYTFHGIPTGLYFVGAFLWNNEGAGPDLETDVHEIDETATLTIDTAFSSQMTATHDVYLGLSQPGSGTISGTVHVGSAISTAPVEVLLFSGNPFTTSPTLLDEQPVTLSGGSSAYQLFNTPLTPVFVMAWADTNGDGTIEFDTDQFAFALQDPVSVDPTTSEETGVDLWLDTEASGLGSIQGTIALSAPLRQCNVSVLAFSSNFDSNAGANVIGVANVTGADTGSIAFELSSMPIEPLYLYALIETPGLVETQVTGEVPYTAGSNGDPVAIDLTAAQPNVTGVSFAVGAGRVSGSIQLTGTPSDVAEGWVTATQSIQGEISIVQFAEVTFNQGSSNVTYEVFGLLDGTYQMTFIPDLTMTGDLLKNAASVTGAVGSPASVTIMSGSPVVSDFAYTFQPN